MQCYTRAHYYPKTTLRSDCPAPPKEIYKKRCFFLPEPTKKGRPWCPDGIVLPPPLDHIKRVMFNPVDDLHREKNMEEMVHFINKTNWTCGQDVVKYGARKSKFSDSVKYSMQSTYRSQFSGHWMTAEPRRNPNVIVAQGATPTTYHLVPYREPKNHQFVIKRTGDSAFEEPIRRNLPVKLPHYIMELYPGPQVPEHLRKKLEQKEMVYKMGLVP